MKYRSQAGVAHLGLVLLIVLVLGVVGGGGYYVWHKNQDKNADSSQKTTDSDSKDSNSNNIDPGASGNGWSEPIHSGKHAYAVSFPDGWSVLKDTNSDSFMISGETQPVTSAGKAAKVTSTVFGSDGPIVLFVTVQARSDVPQGTVSEFTLQNGKENPIKGKKYAYEYTADSTGEGLGGQRIKGDRDYTYVFDVGDGKELRVMYFVYASDPRNLVQTIDQLVNTIKLN